MKFKNKDFVQITNYIKDNAKARQKEYFLEKYKKENRKEYETKDKYLNSHVKKIIFLISNKEEFLERYPDIFNERPNSEGCFNGCIPLIWVDDFDSKEMGWDDFGTEILCNLIHEYCHLEDYYKDPREFRTREEVDKEEIAFLGTVDFIKNKIKDNFSMEVYKQLLERHEQKISDFNENVSDVAHYIACRKICKERNKNQIKDF